MTTHTPARNLDVLMLVTRRELAARGRSPAYIVSGVVILLILTAGVLLPQLLGDDTVTWELGALGSGSEEILAVAETIAADGVGEDQTFEMKVSVFEDRAAAQQALADDEIEFVVIDGAEILRQGSSGFAGSDAEQAVQEAAAVVALEDQLQGSNTTVAEVAGLLRANPLQVSTVAGVTDQNLEDARSIIAYGGMMMLYISILSFGAWTLMGIAEEKSSRVVEVLLASVKPWQLLAGKIIGIGALGLAQFALTVGYALLLIRLTDALTLPAIPLDSAVTLIVWFVLGFSLYSVLYATAGSLVSRMEDAQSVAFPISMIAIVGFLVSFNVLDNPAGLLGRIMSLVPFTAPFVVPIRVAYQEMPLWEHLLAVGVSLAAMVVLVRIAARIYAGGLLHFGGRMKVGAAWRASEG